VNNVQTKNDLRFGRQSEVNFSFGANYSNQFYVGASIGIANVNYNTNDIYKEKGFNVTENNDYELSYRQSQLTRGSGFNAKIGALYRPIPNVRIGATIESPTWYTIDDSYSEGLDTKYGKSRIDSQFVNDDEFYDFTYNLRTPLKISTGISYFFNDKGFISADIDYIDYSTINFAQANTDDIQVISDNNKAVMSKFTDAINFRIGAEYKIDKLMLRAGYGSQGDPYISTDNKSFSISTFSGGLGYRINNYYVDMTYQKVVSDSERWPYSLNDVPTSIANIRNNRSNIFLTIGTRF
jgi:long-subunit fatty acid transport protein